MHGVLGQRRISTTISATVIPLARHSSRKATVMRVPCTRGLPPRCSLSETIHFLSLMISFSIERRSVLVKQRNFCVPVVCQHNQIRLYSRAQSHYRLSGNTNKDARIKTEAYEP